MTFISSAVAPTCTIDSSVCKVGVSVISSSILIVFKTRSQNDLNRLVCRYVSGQS